MGFTVRDLSKSYAGKQILSNISFEVGDQELVSIIGPSGVGKTTLLKIIAGLDQADQGTLTFSPPVSRRDPVILVFQDYVLFPTMNVTDNVAFGLKARRRPAAKIRERVSQMLHYFQLKDVAASYPAQLSAGQKQRVAIARAMVVNPAVLLLDEPFANLDRNLKMETANFIRETQKTFQITTMSVTHDLEEAFAMSDRIGIMLHGRLQQFDTPREIYFRPCSSSVASFLGPVNSIGPEVARELGHPMSPHDPPLAVRPESLRLMPDPTGPGYIEEVRFAGHYIVYQVRVREKLLTVYAQHQAFEHGQRVAIHLVHKDEETSSQPPLPLLAKEGSQEDRGLMESRGLEWADFR